MGTWWENGRQYSDWILGTVFFTKRAVRQGDRGPEFLNTLSLQVFKTQLPKALSNLSSFRDDSALARLLRVEMLKALTTLNCSMILHILDIFFSKTMKEKSLSAVHESLHSPCPFCGPDKFPCAWTWSPAPAPDFHLYLKNVEETIVFKQKAEKSLLRFIFSDIFGKEERTERSQLSPSGHNP